MYRFEHLRGVHIMRFAKQVAFVLVTAVGSAPALLGQQPPATAPRETLAWAPMPAKPSSWVAPNRPHWKLSEILARHKGQANWSEPIVRSGALEADYVSMAPGAKTPRRFHPDTRAWWIVQDGEIRFTIEGQEPFVASKGFMVQVPYRNVYSMETVGAKPSLRLEVHIAGATTM
jgi:quercetin dioxygenase-like cupin family protein